MKIREYKPPKKAVTLQIIKNQNEEIDQFEEVEVLQWLSGGYIQGYTIKDKKGTVIWPVPHTYLKMIRQKITNKKSQ